MIYRVFWRGMWQNDFSTREEALTYIVDQEDSIDNYEIVSDF